MTRQLKIDLSEHNIVLNESEMYIKSDISTMQEIMFEEFRTPGLYIGKESAFSLIWHRKPTGVIVDCGDYITSVVPFHNKHRLSNNCLLSYGGRNVTLKFFRSLSREGYDELDFSNRHHFEVLRKIKEEHGYSTIWRKNLKTKEQLQPLKVSCELVPRNVSHVESIQYVNK